MDRARGRPQVNCLLSTLGHSPWNNSGCGPSSNLTSARTPPTDCPVERVADQ
jgi:hypothetical protein